MRLDLYKETSFRTPTQKLRFLFGLIVEEEAEPESQSCINIVFTTDAGIRRLNREYRKSDHATDVLSFNIDSNGSSESVYGEVYISVAAAKRQARSYGASLNDEIIRLVCHGLLHLFGYDHRRKRDEAKMKALEEHFLSEMKAG